MKNQTIKTVNKDKNNKWAKFTSFIALSALLVTGSATISTPKAHAAESESTANLSSPVGSDATSVAGLDSGSNASSVSALATAPTSTSTSTSSAIDDVINFGMTFLGTPYQFGSSRTNTSTFDCSDFVHYIFQQKANLNLPTTSASQAAYVKSHSNVVTDWHQLKRGDLMFFMDFHGAKESDYTGYKKSEQPVTHVAVYLGNGKMLQTYSVESGGVRTDNIANTYWDYRFLFGGSVL